MSVSSRRDIQQRGLSGATISHKRERSGMMDLHLVNPQPKRRGGTVILIKYNAPIMFDYSCSECD